MGRRRSREGWRRWRGPRRSAGAGPYALQAAIAACHARRADGGGTDWKRIAELYAELAAWPSPVVELNRAVAVSMADGPAAGLGLPDELADEPALARYHLLPSVARRAAPQLGRLEEAAAEFERAAGLTKNARQRERLLARAEECQSRRGPEAAAPAPAGSTRTPSRS